MARAIRTAKDYLPVAEKLTSLFAEKCSVKSDPPLSELLAKHPKLIGVYNHGPALSPLIYCFTMVKHFCENGGEDRAMLAIFHKYLYQMPGISRAVKHLSQLDHAVNFREFIEVFSNQPFNDVCIIPEGDNCMCGDGVEIQPFRSPRFIEMSVLSGVPLLLCVQLGAEKWAKTVSLSPSAVKMLLKLPLGFNEHLEKTETLSIPLFPTKIPELKINYAVYYPELTKDQLSSDRLVRKEQFTKEAEKVRVVMQTMVDEMESE